MLPRWPTLLHWQGEGLGLSTKGGQPAASGSAPTALIPGGTPAALTRTMPGGFPTFYTHSRRKSAPSRAGDGFWMDEAHAVTLPRW
jgi:hypothetical protein